MKDSTARPILVTGSHRSGTTWVGKMLSASGQTAYLHEPFNPRRRPGWTGNRIPYWFLYVTPANERYYVPVVEDLLALRYPWQSGLSDIRSFRHAALYAVDGARSVRYRLRRARPLVKDPIALFSAPWLADRFDAQVVIMVRHPA
ncbi:MAG: sulfotransferase, partial [Actinomycetota bacterium]